MTLPPLKPASATRKALPPLSRKPPLPMSPVASEWQIDERAPRRGNCACCAGRGHFVWHASMRITRECTACNGTGA